MRVTVVVTLEVMTRLEFPKSPADRTQYEMLLADQIRRSINGTASQEYVVCGVVVGAFRE